MTEAQLKRVNELIERRDENVEVTDVRLMPLPPGSVLGVFTEEHGGTLLAVIEPEPTRRHVYAWDAPR